jgi:hypothetical protein
MTRAGKLKPPVSPKEITSALGINDPKEIKDLEAAWKKAQEISAAKFKKQPAGAAAGKTGPDDSAEAWAKLNRPGA